MSNVQIAMIITALSIIASSMAVIAGCRKIERYEKVSNAGIILCILSLVFGVFFGRIYYFFLDSNNVDAAFFVPNMQFGLFGILAGCLLAVAVVKCIFKINGKMLLDIMAPALVLLVMAQRINDYFLGANFGRLVKSSIFTRFPFAVYMPVGKGGMWIMAVFSYEFVFCLLILIMLMMLRKNNGRGINFTYALGMYCLGRVVFESMRQDSLYVGFVKVAQVISIVMALAVIISYMVIAKKKKSISCKGIIMMSILMAAAVGAGFYCEFFMGTEVEKLYTSVIAISMVVLWCILTYLYRKSLSTEPVKVVKKNY